MVLSGANGLQRLAARLPSAFARASLAPVARDGAWPLVAAGALGIGLGAYAVGISTLESRWLVLLLLAVMGPFVLMVVGEVRRVLLAALLLDVPLQIDTHLNFRTELAELGALGGWNVSLTTVALIGLYGLWAMELLAQPRRAARPAFRASLPLGLYVTVAMLSILVAYDAQLAWFEVFLFGQMFLMFLYVVSTVRTRADVVFVISLLLAGLALEGLLMVVLRFAGSGAAIPGLAARVDVAAAAQGQTTRLVGTLGGANMAAAYLSLLLPLALGSFLLARLGPLHRLLAVAAFMFGTAGLLLTQSRGGWIACGVGVAILVVAAIRRGWLSFGVPLGASPFALLLAVALQDFILARAIGDDEGSARSRIPLNWLALRIIEDHPLIGIGANNYVLGMAEYATPNFSEYAGDWLFVVHNKYLLVWAETGLVGLLAFLGFLLATLWNGWAGWQLRDRLLSPFALGLVAAMVGHLVHMQVDFFSGRPQLQTLWLSAALITAIARIGAAERQGRSASITATHGPRRLDRAEPGHARQGGVASCPDRSREDGTRWCAWQRS